MDNPRVVGHIVAVQGFRVKVELLPETKSAQRATLDGVQTAVAINAYVTFSIGAGQSVIGIITDLEARESYDPTTGDDLTLELIKPRRTASIQLLGSIEFSEKVGTFTPGITVLPTLDTPAEICAPDALRAVFELPPRRNKPDGYDGTDYDCDLKIGSPTGQSRSSVKASYNDLFARPLAIVGNTGSGKSYSVSSLIQKAMATLGSAGNEPHIFVLDINGEYGNAFGLPKIQRKPDHVYLNGTDFGIPLWLLNATEICAWLSASEQTQEPVLKDWWALAKAQSASGRLANDANAVQHALTKAQALLQALDSHGRPIKVPCMHLCGIIKSYVGHRNLAGYTALKSALLQYKDLLKTDAKPDFDPPPNEKDIREATNKLIDELKTIMSVELAVASLSAATADSPRYIPREKLVNPTLLDSATTPEDASRIEQHLTTLKLRLKTRRDDPRWQAFLNYENPETKFSSFEEWMHRFGIGQRQGPRVSVIDLSMLGHEVLPYACSAIARVLLDARENLVSDKRYKHPWVLVLEEAHNYARPARANDERGQVQSRLTFERIAKEGRKFGLSLIVASQRPSEISETIISQCANFVSHRLQNPDDIDHFRRIIPVQARRLLDQVTILSSGEAIVFGSAFHVPTRVQIDVPSPHPHSQTAAPYYEWTTDDAAFPLSEVTENWGLTQEPGAEDALAANDSAIENNSGEDSF